MATSETKPEPLPVGAAVTSKTVPDKDPVRTLSRYCPCTEPDRIAALAADGKGLGPNEAARCLAYLMRLFVELKRIRKEDRNRGVDLPTLVGLFVHVTEMDREKGHEYFRLAVSKKWIEEVPDTFGKGSGYFQLGANAVERDGCAWEVPAQLPPPASSGGARTEREVAPKMVQGITLTRAALLVSDDDDSAARAAKKRWRNKKSIRLPKAIGKSLEHSQEDIYEPSALADFVEKVDGAKPKGKPALATALRNRQVRGLPLSHPS